MASSSAASSSQPAASMSSAPAATTAAAAQQTTATAIRTRLEATEGLVIPQVLIPLYSPSHFALGPALNSQPPSTLDPLFPLIASDEQLLYQTLDFDWGLKYTPTNPLRHWPQPSSDWVTWVDRMVKTKKDQWKALGIYDAIMLSREKFVIDKSLFFSSLFFWSTSANAFFFRCGPMSPTIQDVCFLTGLPAHEEDITPRLTFDLSFEHPKTDKGKGVTALSHFVSACMGQVEVSDQEHLAFLIYWLNRFIFCSRPPTT